jgi:hypothetical protein
MLPGRANALSDIERTRRPWGQAEQAYRRGDALEKRRKRGCRLHSGRTAVGDTGISGNSPEAFKAQCEPLAVREVFDAIWQMYGATIEPLQGFARHPRRNESSRPKSAGGRRDMNDTASEFERLLGHAALKLWPDLPRDVQELLFETAVPIDPEIRNSLAVFLHQHHPRTAHPPKPTQLA